MKSFIRFFFFIAVVYSLLTSVIHLLKSSELEQEYCLDQFQVVNTENDRWHQRDWELNDFSKSFCATYESKEAISKQEGMKRNSIIYELGSYENVWGTVYRELVRESKTYIDFLVDSLRILSNEQRLSKQDLAEMVVSFVQDIPYSYVRVGECSESDNYGKPCIGSIALGLLTPYEFLHSLYGDCDTRAVLIFTVLEEMGFEPMIVVSNEYAHAMLALNITATGDHLKHRGKNYYFWETTGKGWPLGMLPPNSNNVKYWKVALVNESI